MRVVDADKMFDDLVFQESSPEKDAILQYINKQPTAEAIPIWFIRSVRDDKKYEKHRAGVNNVLRLWRKYVATD